MSEMLCGQPVILSSALTSVQWVPRSWRERLFSLPWRPLKRFVAVEQPAVAYKMSVDGKVVWFMHPKAWDRLRAATSEAPGA